MVGEACLPSNAYYPYTPNYTLYSGVHVCWSEHSDSSFVYGFMRLVYGLVTMPKTTYIVICRKANILPQMMPHLYIMADNLLDVSSHLKGRVGKELPHSNTVDSRYLEFKGTL